MEPCPLEELRAMLAPSKVDTANFSYVIFGGSARIARRLDFAQNICANYRLMILVNDELTQFFADSEYATAYSQIDLAAAVVAEQIEHLAVGSRETAAAEANVVRRSVFVHTCVAEKYENGDMMQTRFASTFMGVLAAALAEREQFSMLKQLRNVVTGGGGLGFLFEAQVHKTLFQACKAGGELQLRRMYPSGYQRTGTKQECASLRLTAPRKGFICTPEDIAQLKENEYGIPVIPNIPLLGAVIKARSADDQPQCDIELQVISGTHAGGKDRHADIEESMGTCSTSTMMIYCCCHANFETFQYVDGFAPDVTQYKMLCEWEANPTNPAKKRKIP
jgi:hypothetical protein